MTVSNISLIRHEGFRVARMTDEDGRIERGGDVGNIIKT